MSIKEQLLVRKKSQIISLFLSIMKGFLLLTFIIFIQTVYSQTTTASSLQRKLIPYGPENGDATLATGDDQVSPPIYIPIRFPFFNHKYDEIKIEINGLILFGNRETCPTSLGSGIHKESTDSTLRVRV